MENIKFIFSSYFMFIISLCLSSSTFSSIGTCKENEKKGYIERHSLIKIIDSDCKENEMDGLCSFLIGAPDKVDSRKFALFTFERIVKGKTQTYVNLQPDYYDQEVRVGIELAQDTLASVTVTAVYENIGGCTLKSHINIGEVEIK